MKLCYAIQNKKRGMLSTNVVLLHDNAQPHIFAQNQELIESFGWEQIVIPSIFSAVSYCHCYDNDNYVKITVQHWPYSRVASFFEAVFRN